MKKLDSHNIAAEFEPATLLDLNPVSGGGLQASVIAALEELKQQLLLETARARSDLAILACLRRAADEAASLAWATPFPLLVLPELFAEKAAEACVRSQRQQDIRRQSLGLIGPDA
jgi:hypothetical protein